MIDRTQAAEPSGPIVVDARGRRCPLPVIDLARAAASAPAGALITVLADDPAASSDIPAWCRMRGHTYLGSAPEGEGVRTERAVGGRGDGRTDDEGGPGAASAHRIRLQGS